MNRAFMEYAEPVGGPSMARVAQAARDANAYVVFPFYEKVQEGELYNSAAFLDRSGEVIGLYRKNMIPLVNVNGVEGNEEFYGRSLWSAPNGELVAVAGTEGDEILYCEIDTDLGKRLREEWGFFRDRRPEAYAEVTAR